MPSIKLSSPSPYEDADERPPKRAKGYTPGAGFVLDPYGPQATPNPANPTKKEDPAPPQTHQSEEKAITKEGLSGLTVMRRKRPDSDRVKPAKSFLGRRKAQQKCRFRGLDFTTSEAFNRSKLDPRAATDKTFKRELQAITGAIDRFAASGYKDQSDITYLRSAISKLSLDPRVNLNTLIDSRFMEDEGVKRIFLRYEPTKFPVDIVDDICVLWLRWKCENLDPNLMRGFSRNKHSNFVKDGTSETVEGTTHSWQLEKGYEHRISANLEGSNALWVGQWWPFRAAARRGQ